MTEGNGAMVAHRYLESGLSEYSVRGIRPMLSLLGPAMRSMPIPADARLLHSVPDLACFFQRRGLPSVVSFQNYVLDPDMAAYSSRPQRIYYQSLLRSRHRRSVRQATVLTAVSQFTANIARSDLGIEKPIEIIHNAVDHDLFFPAAKTENRSGLRVLFSGNPSIRKGFQYLPAIARGFPMGMELQIASGLRGRHPNLGNEKNIRVLGPIPFKHMPDLYRSVDLCVAPFYREGLSFSVLEAMSCGLPVVAFDASSMSELVHHQKGGFLTPVGDVSAMIQAIVRLSEDRSLLTRMGEYNRQLIEERFTLKTMREAYQRVFEGLMA
jgi:glycosyltransferase involved in cell wall biosynthesis